jgi:hypothetical protein
MQRFDGGFWPPNCSTNLLWQFLMEPVIQQVFTMNTRSSKEYWYIFTTMWKQASTSYLSSRLTDNASGKLLIIFILSYLFVLPSSFLRIHKTHNHTSLQVWHANVLHVCSFCKPTFSGATSEWDAPYYPSWGQCNIFISTSMDQFHLYTDHSDLTCLSFKNLKGQLAAGSRPPGM